MIRYEINLEQALLHFDQLYKFIHNWKIDNKKITNATKLVKKLAQYLLKQDTDKYPY